MNARSTACFLIVFTAGSLAVCSTAWGGSIRGSVTYSGPAPAPKTLPMTIDQYVCGQQKVSEELVLGAGKGILHAVVSLRNPPSGARWDPPDTPAQIDQQQCSFVPRVVMVPVGGTVEILNSDRLLHNVHSVSVHNPTFNRTQPRGRTISMVFKRPEIIRIDCDLHSWMRGWIVVADHPFFAVTGPAGEFSLENVPAGRYTLQVWHETLGSLTKEVTVRESEVTAVTVEMKKQ